MKEESLDQNIVEAMCPSLSHLRDSFELLRPNELFQIREVTARLNELEPEATKILSISVDN